MCSQTLTLQCCGDSFVWRHKNYFENFKTICGLSKYRSWERGLVTNKRSGDFTLTAQPTMSITLDALNSA